jgi:hypothetical protein
MKRIVKILKDIYKGFELAEKNRHHNGWGKL